MPNKACIQQFLHYLFNFYLLKRPIVIKSYVWWFRTWNEWNRVIMGSSRRWLGKNHKEVIKFSQQVLEVVQLLGCQATSNCTAVFQRVKKESHIGIEYFPINILQRDFLN